MSSLDNRESSSNLQEQVDKFLNELRKENEGLDEQLLEKIRKFLYTFIEESEGLNEQLEQINTYYKQHIEQLRELIEDLQDLILMLTELRKKRGRKWWTSSSSRSWRAHPVAALESLLRLKKADGN